jgi:hypothetical protein
MPAASNTASDAASYRGPGCGAAFCPPSVRLLSAFCPPSVRLLSAFCPPSVRLLSAFCPPSVRLLSASFLLLFCFPGCCKTPTSRGLSRLVPASFTRPIIQGGKRGNGFPQRCWSGARNSSALNSPRKIELKSASDAKQVVERRTRLLRLDVPEPRPANSYHFRKALLGDPLLDPFVPERRANPRHGFLILVPFHRWPFMALFSGQQMAIKGHPVSQASAGGFGAPGAKILRRTERRGA